MAEFQVAKPLVLSRGLEPVLISGYEHRMGSQMRCQWAAKKWDDSHGMGEVDSLARH